MDEPALMSLLARELDLEPEDLADEEEISMQTLPKWDSLTHTRIILALETITIVMSQGCVEVGF